MTKMSEENKKETAKKAVETPKNEEVVATPVVEKTPVFEEVKAKKIPKKRIKKEIEATEVDVVVETTPVAEKTPVI
jgi:hypothetical protein